MNIYCGNLAWTVQEDELRAMFAEFGEVESFKVIRDLESGKSKGFGFIEMPEDTGMKAILALDGKEYFGRILKVSRGRERQGKKRGSRR